MLRQTLRRIVSSTLPALYRPVCRFPTRNFAVSTELSNRSLKDSDPETYEIIQKEKARQKDGLEMIASEVRSIHTLSNCYSFLNRLSFCRTLPRVQLWKHWVRVSQTNTAKGTLERDTMAATNLLTKMSAFASLERCKSFISTLLNGASMCSRSQALPPTLQSIPVCYSHTIALWGWTSPMAAISPTAT